MLLLSPVILLASSLGYGQEAPPSTSIFVKGFSFSGNTVISRNELEIVTQSSSTINGTFNVTAGGLISQSGSLAVAGNASFNTTAAPTLGSENLANGSALTLATSTVGGNLTATTTAGDITLPGGQTLTVAGAATLTPAGTVNLLGTTQIGGIQTLNGGSGSTFVLTADTNLNALALPTAGNITVNLTGTQATFAGAPLLPAAVSLANAGNSFGGTVSVTTASPAFTGTVTNTHNLMQSAAVTLNPGQGLTVTDLGGTAGTRGNITLPNAGNTFNTLSFTGGDIAWQQANAVTIGNVSANAGATSTGALTISANGSIAQTGAVVAAGTTTLSAGAANNITLNNVGNNFSTVGISSGNNVSLTDANALDLGSSTINGALNVNTGGALTQRGALTVTGVTTLAAGAANNITLNNAGNNFNTVGITSGNNVAVTDVNALDLGTSTVSGTLNVTTAGALTQSGPVTVAGNTTLAAGVTNNILLNNAGNDFSTVAMTSGNNVSLTDANALNLAASTVSGTLTVASNGVLTQSGALSVTGITTLAAGVSNNITLNNAANNFSTVGVTSGNNVTLTDANALNLGASTVSGTLNVTTNGALTQSGALNVTGTTTLTAGAGNNLTLTNAANDFSTVGITSGNNVALVDANALTLYASTASGIVSVNATDLTVGGAVSSTGGSLNLSGANTVIQLANLTVNGANNVTVTTTTGPITMAPAATTTSGAGVINYTAGTDVTLGSLVTGGAVNVTANGGSVLSAAGSSTNVTAGLNSTVQALGGVTSVTGTILAPITVNVIGGTLGVAVAGAVTETIGAVSGVFTGTVSPSNTLALLNNPPGFVLFNSTILNPLPIPGNPLLGVGLLSEFSGYLNPEVYIPAFYLAPSGAVTINDITPLYIPQTLLAESPVSLNGDKQAVARGIPPCFPESGCRPGASVLTVPPDAESLELPAAK